MRLVFMGTAAFAVPTLCRLFEGGHVITGVITQTDKPSGRGHDVHFSPVKQKALDYHLRVFQPASLKSDETRELIQRLEPEIVIVVAYGKIIPPWLIHFPKYGIVNLHGSLLPRYRGAAPVNWAIANGESATGVSTMQIDEGLDTGPVYASEMTPIGPDENAFELSKRLATLGCGLMSRTITGILDGTLKPQPQDDTQASLAPLLKKHHGFVDWQAPAAAIHNKVRAFVPWPSATARFRGQPVKILRSRLSQDPPEKGDPGAIALSKGCLMVCCGDGRLLELVHVQPESRKSVSGADFANGARILAGEKFEAMIQ